MVVYQIDHTSKLSLAAAINPKQAFGVDFYWADVIQKTWAWRMLFWVPVMTSCKSCLLQTFTCIITLASLFFFLSVVRRPAAWGEAKASSLFTFSMLGLYENCVWAKSPTEAGSWNYCLWRTQQQHFLTLNAQVLHHYLCALLSSFMDRIKACTICFIFVTTRQSWIFRKKGFLRWVSSFVAACCCKLL